jgi:hypothetical protein
MAEALRDAYGDLFLIKARPTESDRPAILGKFRSYHNVSDNVAKLMTNTFFQLLKLADLSVATDRLPSALENGSKVSEAPKADEELPSLPALVASSLHYDIQIHLPATKDVEVYNAIFKSLREHLVVE